MVRSSAGAKLSDTLSQKQAKCRDFGWNLIYWGGRDWRIGLLGKSVRPYLKNKLKSKRTESMGLTNMRP
jgi:hypothetical protein